MEWHSDHWSDLTQINLYTAIIVCCFTWFQFFVIFTSAMDLIEFLNLLICLPDRGKAGSLSSHNIDSNTEIST